MSLDEGRFFNERLMALARADDIPKRDTPVEWITYDLWNTIRSVDEKLGRGIMEPVFKFQRAQTDPKRMGIRNLRDYFVYRDGDVGKE